MAYQLVKGIFRVKCNHPSCPFDAVLRVTRKIMGVTEADVEEETLKYVRDMALVRHDSIYGPRHTLAQPDIRRVSGTYEEIGGRPSALKAQPQAVIIQEYKKGERVLQKGDNASTVCEVLKGSAYPERDPTYKYQAGDSFGAAALLSDKNRTANITAAEDGTRIAFYNIVELRRQDARKAAELYNKAMEDIFNVVANLEKLVGRLEKKLEKEEIINSNQKQRIKELEKELIGRAR
jgi:CRP-like cAMP-binding protein